MQVITLINVYLDKQAHIRVNGRVASERSASAHGEALRAFFRLVYELGFKITDPANIGDRHIQAACEDWYRRKLAPKTIQGYLSHLRIYTGRIGKKGLVKKIEHYLPDVPKNELRVSTTAKKSKSWAEAGIDVAEKVREAQALDSRFAVMLMMQVAFGFRRKEVLQVKPWVVDREVRVAATETKGNRPRDIYLDTPAQRWVLDEAKRITKGKNDTLGWKERLDGKKFGGADLRKASFAYSEGRYDRLMQKIGLTKAESECTGHGLRAQYAENSVLLQGLIPPTLGGTPGQMPRGERDVILLKTSEGLGHSRLSVTTAYCGSFGRQGEPDGLDLAKNTIEAGLMAITIDQVKAIPVERLQQCMGLATEVAAIGVYCDPQKAQTLWENHSRRHAVEWLPPTADSNLAALQAAAMSIMGVQGGSPPQPRA